MPETGPRLPSGDLIYRLGAGLLLAGLWTAGALALSGSMASLARAALAAAAVPLIALLLGAGANLGPRSRDALALAAPLGVSWSLHHPALSGWWFRDDPCLLLQILEHGPWRPFVQPASAFLIPWQTFSLGFDFALFGLEPAAFYGHQLLSFAALVVAGYAFLRAYLTRAGASLALTLFAASVPAFAVTRVLMNRHYLEGLILALLSLALYRRSVAGGRFPLAILAAALYLLAATAKEVFVPLVVLLPILASGDRRRRWRHGLPFLLAAGVYGLWRLAMLGWSNSLSGYGALRGELRLASLSVVPPSLGLDRAWQMGIAALALAAALLVLGRRSRKAVLGAGAGLAALAAPLIPVAARLEPRHFFLGAFAAAAVVAAALDAPRSTPRRAAGRALAATLLLLLALASLAGSGFRIRLATALAHYQGEGRFVLEDSRQGLLLTTVEDSTFLACLARLRRQVLARPGGPGFCGDACFCTGELAGEARWRYQEGRIAPTESSAAGGCDAGEPLAVEMAHDRTENRLSWTFGPYREGAYEVLLISGAEPPGVSVPVAVPRQGSTPYWLFEPLRFAVRYRSPEGWRTYSRVFTVEPDGEATAAP